MNFHLQDALGEIEDDYILFDCPGQIELYTHMDVMRKFVDLLQEWNFRWFYFNILTGKTMI